MLMMASSEKHSRKHATHFGLELGLGGSIPMGTLIKCSPNCGPSGSLAFVVVAGGAGGAGGGAAVAATVASIIAAVRKVGQANNKNAPKRSRQAQSTSLSNELKHHAPRPRFRPLRPSPHRRPHPHPHPHPQLHLHSRFNLCSTLCRVFVFILFQHLPLSIPYPHL